jgi:hypothetical protein
MVNQFIILRAAKVFSSSFFGCYKIDHEISFLLLLKSDNQVGNNYQVNVFYFFSTHSCFDFYLIEILKIQEGMQSSTFKMRAFSLLQNTLKGLAQPPQLSLIFRIENI